VWVIGEPPHREGAGGVEAARFSEKVFEFPGDGATALRPLLVGHVTAPPAQRWMTILDAFEGRRRTYNGFEGLKCNDTRNRD